MTDPIRTAVRSTPANTEALHGGDTLDAGGVTLTAPSRHGRTNSTGAARATDHYVASTPNGATDTIRRATRPDSRQVVSNERREHARQLLAQLESIPAPQDPRARIPARPRETIGQMVDRQHGAAMDAIVMTTAGAVVPMAGEVIHHVASRHAVRVAGEVIEHGAGAAINAGAALGTGRRQGVGAGLDAGIEASIDVASEQTGALIGGEGAPPLLQGAAITVMSAGHILEAGEERVGLARQWSEYDRARTEANESDRTGRMNGDALLRLYKRGEIGDIDFGRARSNYAEYMTLRSGLQDIANGR